MDIATSLGLAGTGLAVGVALGWALARPRGAATHGAHAERAAQALREEAARAQAAVAAVEARAKRDVAALQAEMASRIEKLNAEHRAESEKLARHLTEAYDELDNLRAEAAKGVRPGDTGYGFAKTLPLGDL
ncbi:MAG: hypothetical protein JSR75_21015 [Proteobacteria bacterium]|nr:hypothetical protein [Pseudomonadota bacterium]